MFKGSWILRAEPNSSKYLGFVRKHFTYKPTRHAEIAVINNVPADILKECSILVLRLTRDGDITLAKPCENCQRVLKGKVKRVYYTTETGIEKLKL